MVNFICVLISQSWPWTGLLRNIAQILEFVSILQYLCPMCMYFSCSKILVITITLKKAQARIYKHKTNCGGVGFFSFSTYFLLHCIFAYTFKTAIVLIWNEINMFQKAKKMTSATCDKEKANMLICSYHHWLLDDYQAKSLS